MEESDKLPLKRVELSLSKFNEVAIPHHLDLLRQHRTNILKYEECGAYGRVRAEQTHARRVAAQLRALLGELEALRMRVRDADKPSFDAATQRSRDLTLRAIMDYLGVIENSCRAIVASSSPRRIETSPISANRRPLPEEDAVAGSAVSSESVGVLPVEDDRLQLQVDEQDLTMKEREELLRGWSALQGEVRALHDVWQHVHAAALQQRDQVTEVSAHVVEAETNVEAARTHLSAAERLRVGAVSLGGACVGALVGGPAGLVLGLKAGAAAALAGSLLGYLGARAVLPRLAPAPPAPSTVTEEDKAGKKE